MCRFGRLYLFGRRATFRRDTHRPENFDDILRYDPNTDTWTTAGHTEEAAINRIGFTINGIAYIGLGENKEEKPIKTLYRIED